MNLRFRDVAKVVQEGGHFSVFELPRGFGVEEITRAMPKKGVFLVETDERENYSVKVVEGLREQVRSKQKNELVLVFRESERFSEAAQNKFLKLLEEPNENVRFIFITEDRSNLLPTVRSRATTWAVQRINTRETEVLLAGVSGEKRQQILFLAEGLPGEMKKLAGDEKYFRTQVEIVKMAKTLIGGGDYEKLLVAESLKKDSDKAKEVVGVTINMLKKMVKNNPKLTKLLKRMMEIHEGLSKNVNVRLSLASVVLNGK